MITRRHLFRDAALGSAGLALLPFTEHMRAFAAGAGAKLPKRFVFFTTANGVDPGYLFPERPDGRDGNTLTPAKEVDGSAIDKIVDRPLADIALPPWLKSLEPVLEHTTCITGLSGKMCRGWHSVGFGALGAHAAGF